MKRLPRYLLFLLLLGWTTGCKDTEDGEEIYPSVITELVMLYIDESMNTIIETDDGIVRRATTKLEGMAPNLFGRYLCSYVLTASGEVDIYSMQGVRVLGDLTQSDEPHAYDPVGLISIWKKGRFISMHLLPKTQANPLAHGWGFVRGTLHANAAGGNTYPLLLSHDQKDDPLAYSSDLYMCLALDSVGKELGDKDSIELTIQEFDTRRTWRFGAK